MTTNLTDHLELTSTVFVVEDDADTAAFARLALRRAGHEVSTFRSPAEALEALTASECDLLLTDVRLPGMSGLELLARVRDVQPALPVVVMTAYATVDDTITALRHGAADYLLKPLTLESLTGTVGAVLTHHQLASDRVLAIGAHPDDVEIGVGGTLSAHSRRGDDVTILTLSCGESGGQPEQRRAEARRAAATLGADLVHGSLPDTRIAPHGETIELIEQVVRHVQPTIVYTHSSHDVHQDHRAAHQASLVACRAVPTLLCYQAPSATVDFAPQRFVTVDADIDRKLAAIAAYRSQTSKCAYLADDLLRATTRYWGRFGSGLHAEPLEIVRDRVEATADHTLSTSRKDLHHAITAA